MLEHRQPFDSLRERLGGNLTDQHGLRMTLSDGGFLLLQSPAESTLQDALRSEMGLGTPAPQRTSVHGDYALLWLTPAEWLLELPAKQIDSLRVALTQRLAGSLAVVIDMSDAFACFEVSGTRAAEALMTGCSIDLRTHTFPTGRIARTVLAEIPIIIWKTDRPQYFRCLVDRSFTDHLCNWLVDVARTQ